MLGHAKARRGTVKGRLARRVRAVSLRFALLRSVARRSVLPRSDSSRFARPPLRARGVFVATFAAGVRYGTMLARQ